MDQLTHRPLRLVAAVVLLALAAGRGDGGRPPGVRRGRRAAGRPGRGLVHWAAPRSHAYGCKLASAGFVISLDPDPRPGAGDSGWARAGGDYGRESCTEPNAVVMEICAFSSAVSADKPSKTTPDQSTTT